jgi:microcompartment protein CcmL/EutN
VSADNSTAGPVGYDGEHIGNPSKLSTAVDAAAASMHDRAGSSVAACVEYAALLLRRYALAGDLANVEAALGAGEMAVSRAGDNPRARAVALNVLANARAAVFQVRGGHADITAAVAAQREAVELLDPADPDRAALQVNLADRLLAAHIVTRERELVEEAVRLGEDVLTRNLPNAWRAAALDGLGRALRARYDHTGNRRDLERSAAAQAESLAGTPTAAPERAARLNNLANARWVSYQVTGDLGALDDAVAGYQEAARAAMYPEARAACLLGLGSAHWAEWSRHRTTVDLDAATAAYTEA